MEVRAILLKWLLIYRKKTNCKIGALIALEYSESIFATDDRAIKNNIQTLNVDRGGALFCCCVTKLVNFATG